MFEWIELLIKSMKGEYKQIAKNGGNAMLENDGKEIKIIFRNGHAAASASESFDVGLGGISFFCWIIMQISKIRIFNREAIKIITNLQAI